MMCSYLPVQLMPCWLLVAVARVREVLGSVKMARIPDGDPRVPGVLTWRARALPVVDLAVGVGGLTPLSGEDCRPRTVILETSGGAFAVPVDAVREVVRLEERGFVARHVVPQGLVELEAAVGGVVMGLFDPETFKERLTSSLSVRHGG
jgi:chemotaxis signal transduction protein